MTLPDGPGADDPHHARALCLGTVAGEIRAAVTRDDERALIVASACRSLGETEAGEAARRWRRRARRIEGRIESRELEVREAADGTHFARLKSHRSEVRGDPAWERRCARDAVRQTLPHALPAAEAGRLAVITQTVPATEGHTASEARTADLRAWERLTRSLGWQEYVVGGFVADDVTWSCPRSRRKAGAPDRPGEWWHYHQQGVIELAVPLASVPRAPEARGWLGQWAVVRWLHRQEAGASVLPRPRAARRLRRWIETLRTERAAGVPHSVPASPQALAGLDRSLYPGRDWGWLRGAAADIRRTYLSTCAEDSGCAVTIGPPHRGVGSVREAIRYAGHLPTSVPEGRVAELLLAQSGGRLRRWFGAWRFDRPADPDAAPVEAEPVPIEEDPVIDSRSRWVADVPLEPMPGPPPRAGPGRQEWVTERARRTAALVLFWQRAYDAGAAWAARVHGDTAAVRWAAGVYAHHARAADAVREDSNV